MTVIRHREVEDGLEGCTLDECEKGIEPFEFESVVGTEGFHCGGWRDMEISVLDD